MKSRIITMLLVAMAAYAQAQTISVQGVLRDENKRALDNGFYQVIFKIYDAPTGGTALWTDTYSSIEVRNGVFQANLGENTSIASLAFDKTYYVGVAVEGNAEMTPRLEMSTFPYALAINGNSNKFPSNGNVVIEEDSLMISQGDIVLDEGALRLKGGDGRIVFNDGTSLNTAEFGGPAASLLNPSGISINADSDTTGTGTIEFQISGQTKASISQLGNLTAPKFIDTNSSYYLDPAGSSNLHTLTLTNDMYMSGKIYELGATSYFLEPAAKSTLNRLSLGGTNGTIFDVPLYVNSGTSNPVGNNVIYQYSGNGTTTFSSAASLSFNNASAIFVNDVLCGGVLSTFLTLTSSDSRIKKIKGVSDSQADLDVLNQIKVTDYQMIDQVKFDSRTFKKVIAQEVAAVYPEAVSLKDEVIPNIYQTAQKFGLENNTLSIAVERAHELKAGDKIKLLTNKGEIPQIEVLEVIDANTFNVALDYQPELVFVYGKWVDDFHVVDYEAISMLNVSATQELHKIIQDQQQQIHQLEAKLEKLSEVEQKLNQLTALEAKLDLLLSEEVKVNVTQNQP